MLNKIKSGIYRIINILDGKGYVGSAVVFSKRFGCHKSELQHNKHHSIHLQRAWNRDGEEAFKFEIIEFVEDKNKLIEREQYWIDYYKSYDDKYGYNICKIAGSRLGYHHTEETKRKFKGRKVSEETKEKLRLARLGTHLSEEVKQKMSGPRPDFIPWNKGIEWELGPRSELHNQHLKEAWELRLTNGYISPLKGKPISEEHYEKSQPTMFKKDRIPWNNGIETGLMPEEQKRAIGNANRGKKKPPFSNEHLQNLSLSHLGKKSSLETKAKMSEAQKEVWRKRKEGTI